jgi:hypothetical protein
MQFSPPHTYDMLKFCRDTVNKNWRKSTFDLESLVIPPSFKGYEQIQIRQMLKNFYQYHYFSYEYWLDDAKHRPEEYRPALVSEQENVFDLWTFDSILYEIILVLSKRFPTVLFKCSYFFNFYSTDCQYYIRAGKCILD